MFRISLLSLLIFAFVTALMAQTSDSMISVPKRLVSVGVVQQIEAQNKIDETKQKIETYGKWVGLGKEVGTAVRDGLGALTDETNKFSKTGVGKFTMFIIAFKVLGYPIIQFFFGMLIWIFGTIVATVFFKNNFMPLKKVKVTPDGCKIIEYEPSLSDKWKECGGTGGSMAVFAVCYIVFCLIISAVIFIH